MSEAKASSHSCPYCGGKFHSDEVLFVDKEMGPYYDKVRADFMRKCNASHEMNTDDMGNPVFMGRYYQCKAPNEVLIYGKEGLPALLRAYPSTASTPEELLAGYKDVQSETYNEYEEEMQQEEEQPDVPDEETIRLPDRACPLCHCLLPLNYEEIPLYNVCLYGGRAAGKTTYLLALKNQLNIQLQQCGLGTAAVTEACEEYFESEKKLLEEKKATPMDGRLFPLIFEYSNPKQEKSFIAFYDIAGEGVLDGKGDVNLKYLLGFEGLCNAETIMMIIDPNMLCGGQYFHDEAESRNAQTLQFDLAEEDALLGIGNDGKQLTHDFCDTSLDVFLAKVYDTARFLERLRNLVVVVTKMDQPFRTDHSYFDTPYDILSKGDNVTQVHKGGVNISILRKVSRQIANFLDDKVGNDKKICNKIADAFHGQIKRMYMLGVSTYTPKQQGNSVEFVSDTADSAPGYRLIEPFLAVLALYDLAPQKEQTEAENRPATNGGRRGLGRLFSGR